MGHFSMEKSLNPGSALSGNQQPKQEKAPPKPESTFGNQIKVAANANASQGKGKR